MTDARQYKERLETEKQRLERMIASRKQSAFEHSSSSVNDSFPNSGDSEYADAATDTFYQELDHTMLNKYRLRISMVRQALDRIEAGRFGTCVRCHREIGEGRLEAIPETPYCRDCEAEVEIQD